ncbi:Crp/Fnr family transcriptional regulator [Anaerosporobacter faecicola]|uniref:Crp/Fnr family transcriptional regulator n=1 Tax=Anaerosporobacter faecicola TaxID=2718714 RepID=UPI00143C8808|nr:Crp/Fnr family transcriptional regulator [Anaerosporobacter faecicola]
MILPEYLKSHPLFQGFSDDDLSHIIENFSFIQKTYNKDEYIILEGDPVHSIGLILSGSVLMEKLDYSGNHYIFNELEELELFAEPFIGSYILSCSVNYKAKTDCSILLFHYKSVNIPSLRYYNCYVRFTENLMYLLALKTRSLLTKIEILSQKSLRERILSFLHILQTHQSLDEYDIRCKYIKRALVKSPNTNLDALKQGGIYVPFNHTELAEYLNVNRSALVRELKRMKDEKILTIEDRIFYLI